MRTLPASGRDLPGVTTPKLNGSVRQGDSAIRSKLYHTARWKRTRKRVLDDDPYCAECRRQGVLQLAEVVDHVLGHDDVDWQRRFFDTRFLQGLCRACHAAKTVKELDGTLEPQRLHERPWTCPIG